MTTAFRSGFVSIVGRPNAGKSTLLNRLAGQDLAVVSPKAQTTRNRILAVRNLESAQLVLVDTPGFHKPKGALNRSMVQATVSSLTEVDTALVLVEIADVPASSEPSPGHALVALCERIAEAGVTAVLALNKIDRVRKKNVVLRWIEAFQGLLDWHAIVPLSALDGQGERELIAELVSTLPEGPALYPEEMITDRAERFFVSELIRAEVLERTRQEVPYSAAVEVEEFRDEETRTFIRCVILVEREQQKRIVVGRGGAGIKAIGTAAREAIGRFLDRPVDLRLFVRVEESWTKNPAILTRLGYDGGAG